MIWEFKLKNGKYFDIKKIDNNVFVEQKGYTIIYHKKYGVLNYLECIVDTEMWEEMSFSRNYCQVRLDWMNIEDFLNIELPKIREYKLKRLIND